MAKKSGYAAGPPWTFVGRAWYQLSLVKSSLAKKLIPPELHVVEAFGHTLGGVYYAEYDASPAGPFREMVVIPGIVWNPPTSCAWAASVMVDSSNAKVHGIQGVGLPSRLASFRAYKTNPERVTSASAKVDPTRQAWADVDVLAERFTMEAASDRSNGKQQLLCSIRFPSVATKSKPTFPFQFQPPQINLHLPSFSGRTKQQPQLLQYTCQLQCRPRLVSAAQFCVPLECTAAPGVGQQRAREDSKSLKGDVQRPTQQQTPSAAHVLPSISDIQEIMTSKALVAFSFDSMKMTVGEPRAVVSKASAARELSQEASVSAA